MKTYENGDEQCDENGAQVKSDEISQVKSEAMTQSDEYCDGNVTQSHENKGHEHHLGDCLKFHSLQGDDCLPKKECVLCTCSECGVEKYKKILESKNPKILTSGDKISWKQWKNIQYEKDGVVRSKMGDQAETGTLHKLVDDYINHLDSMSLHQFNKLN